MTEHEYRVLRRGRIKTGLPGEPWSEWTLVYTGRGAGRPYRTVGAAKGVVSREKRSVERSSYYARRYDYEFKIQRRPVSTEWEDIPE